MREIDARPGPLALSASAARRIAALARAEGRPDIRLRVSVSGGGCSGFQYLFALDDKSEDGDVLVERDGAAVVVDGMSLMYVIGSELDYVEDLTGSYFKVKNPNASSSCGCGNFRLSAAREPRRAALSDVRDRGDDPVGRRDPSGVRRAGFAISHGEREDGASAVSAPIVAADGRVLAALSISGPSSRLTGDRLEAAVRAAVDTAKEISGFGSISPTCSPARSPATSSRCSAPMCSRSRAHMAAISLANSVPIPSSPASTSGRRFWRRTPASDRWLWI